MSFCTLSQSMQHASHTVSMDRAAWGPTIYDRAFEYHFARGLRADIGRGLVRDADGARSRFIDYDESDAERYLRHPEVIYWDFFRGIVNNSCSRIVRGLRP